MDRLTDEEVVMIIGRGRLDEPCHRRDHRQ